MKLMSYRSEISNIYIYIRERRKGRESMSTLITMKPYHINSKETKPLTTKKVSRKYQD